MSIDILHCMQVTDDQSINATAAGCSESRDTRQDHVSIMHTLRTTHGIFVTQVLIMGTHAQQACRQHHKQDRLPVREPTGGGGDWPVLVAGSHECVGFQLDWGA